MKTSCQKTMLLKINIMEKAIEKYFQNAHNFLSSESLTFAGEI